MKIEENSKTSVYEEDNGIKEILKKYKKVTFNVENKEEKEEIRINEIEETILYKIFQKIEKKSEPKILELIGKICLKSENGRNDWFELYIQKMREVKDKNSKILCLSYIWDCISKNEIIDDYFRNFNEISNVNDLIFFLADFLFEKNESLIYLTMFGLSNVVFSKRYEEESPEIFIVLTKKYLQSKNDLNLQFFVSSFFNKFSSEFENIWTNCLVYSIVSFYQSGTINFQDNSSTVSSQYSHSIQIFSFLFSFLKKKNYSSFISFLVHSFENLFGIYLNFFQIKQTLKIN